MSHLTNDDLQNFEAQLRQRRQSLLIAIRERLHQGENGAELTLANQYAAVREQAEADLLADTDIAQLQIELAELQAIDEALARIGAQAYGACTACGGRIAIRRLRAQPAARLCLACQEQAEHRRQTPS